MSVVSGSLIVLTLFMGLIFFTGILSGDTVFNDNKSLIEISTQEDYAQYLENQTKWYEELQPVYTSGLFAEEMAAPAPSVQYSVSKDSSGGASDFSSTNIQVAGVDEGDFLKNDGKYIYQIYDNSLYISEVFPVSDGRIASVTNIAGTPSELFLQGDSLVVFSSQYDNLLMPVKPGEEEIRQDITDATVYDVSDRNDPQVVREVRLPGSYENSRMIRDMVYVLTRESPSYQDPHIPVIVENGEIVTHPSVWCPPIPLSSYVVYTLSSFSLTGTEPPKASSFVMGWDNTLYVSPENAYLAYQKWMPYWFTAKISEESNGDETVIHRFSLNNGNVSYEATGTVPGSLLNQFSLDEYAQNLRIATTDSRYEGDEWITDNNVYVLSSNLTTMGKLEHLAKGERIYSARFVGDLLYLVTFEQMDPLYVIDLSNPNQPGILGELKIPGYSDYLHPYDANHIIGIGKDTAESEWGGLVPAGVKIALFDVSDMNNPREVDSRIIGEKDSSSAVLSDHRAFLLDTNRSIMVLPVKEIMRVPVPNSSYDESYTTAAWQGAYVWGIDPESGFALKGKVEQVPVKPDAYWSDSTVKRPVLMDDILYTVSDGRIVGSNVNSPDARLMILDLIGKKEE